MPDDFITRADVKLLISESEHKIHEILKNMAASFKGVKIYADATKEPPPQPVKWSRQDFPQKIK